MTLAEDARRTDDVPIVPVEHPEWKGAHVRPMSVKALGEFKKMAAPDDADDAQPFEMTMHLMAFLVAHCLCDDEGVRVFRDDEVDWVECNKTMELLDPIASAAVKMHGFDMDEDSDDEDTAKN
jgi:hypothetical protein